MTENELNARLSMMRQGVVDPPLMTDDELPVVQRPLRRRLMFALISSVVVLGVFTMMQLQNPPTHTGTSNPAHTSTTVATQHIHDTSVSMHDSASVFRSHAPNNDFSGTWQVIKQYELPVIPLIPVTGMSGTIGIELRPEELQQLGIYTDSATVFSAYFGGFTFDTSKTTVRNMILGPERSSLLKYIYSGAGTTMIGEVEVPSWDVSRCRPVGYYAVLQSMSQDTIDKIAMIFGDGGTFTSHEKVGKLAASALHSLARTKKPIDEAFNQVINVGKLRLPLKSLFLPIRFQTPWTTMSGGGSEKYRMDVVFIYLATPVCLSAIPPQISAFFGNEYQATLDAVENQLSQRELCDQLHETSILGLCPAKDAPITTVSVGPIPARDHVTVTLKCNSAFAINLKLIDALGNLSYEDAVVHLTSGVNVITIPLANLGLHRGAYTLLLTMDRYETSTRVLID